MTGVGLAQPMRNPLKKLNPINGPKMARAGIQQSSDGIDVVDGVERDAALQAGRLVAEAGGHPGVGALVKTEREKEQDKLEYGNNECSGLQGNTPKFRLLRRVFGCADRAELKDSG